MAPLPSDYEHLDAAASQLTHILHESGIPHVFFGGYAAGLIGSKRVTKDINVITERSAGPAWSCIPEFIWCKDERCWKYVYRDVEVSIAISMPGGGLWDVPSPKTAGRHTVSPKELPKRSFHTKVDIIHPSVLILTKLKVWHAAQISQDLSLNMRTRARLMHIMAALQWLSDEGLRINLKGHPGIPRQELLRLLCRLYRVQHEAGPYLASTLSFDDMRNGLCSSG
ncbi:uncharacterized protein N7459_008001 [Penicillium hispanicum]|uniref:uncharacterized protein n=1 Tax=Penicillium hispanicum TaxID=1080232 RepID=UPI0025422BD2|nr:uncharacterized protein N7459_008001 [Penicillium hispanicum]KAJ5573574.1 hypothetical protein N7459_008001 [Penicillium hispanicum]